MNAAPSPLSCRPGLPLVSVVLPVFNEAAIVDSLTVAIQRAFVGLDARCEILFVDDGSTDASPRCLDALAECHPQVRVIHLSRNFGQQAAVQAGLAHARGDAVVLMDCDMQDAPEAIGQFVSRWREGYDVVYAIRAGRQEGWVKRLSFRAFYRLLAAISATPIPLDAGIFGLVDRRVARQIARLPECDRYFPGLRAWVGFRQIGVAVPRLARYDDRPRVSLAGLFRLAKTAVFSFSAVPLTLFYVIGLSALLIFLGLGSYALVSKLFTDLAIPGWTSHILSASFFGALNALGISVLGEYVVRIYDQVRARPVYLVDRLVNFPARQAEFEAELAADAIHPAAAEAELLDEAAALLDTVRSHLRLHDSGPAANQPDSRAVGSSESRPR